ncbi:32678_t:CDS:2, partial [Racocetra persica]
YLEDIEIDYDSEEEIENNYGIANNMSYHYEDIANNMPYLGYQCEIEDFQDYTWQITNWTSLERRTTGPEFEAGGWKWRILLFPCGNNNPKAVSIYLDFADKKEAPAGWHCCVQFALALWNPEYPKFCVVHYAYHRFTAEESDWGFTQFYEQNKLFVPSKIRPRLLIENNTCNITAFVRIINDPKYLNAELQLLYSIKYFRKAIYQIPTEDDEPIR